MLVKLRVMQGAQAGREVIIPVAEFLIGRGEECHLRPRSDAISRRHCVIVVNDKEVVLRDLGSKNGSYVNGQRVEGSCVVQPGDHVQVGPLQFELVIEHTLGGTKRPAARDVKEVAARTAASVSQDLDIANWLEEDDDTDVSRAVATPETRQFRIDDTANGMNMETHVDSVAGDEELDEGEESWCPTVTRLLPTMRTARRKNASAIVEEERQGQVATASRRTSARTRAKPQPICSSGSLIAAEDARR